MAKVHEIEAKNILTKSNLPSADYVINPYTGCAFSCSYCYASFMGRFVDEPLENWGKYIYIKTNAVELLDQKLASMRKKDKSIMLASVTDAWQYIEEKYEITRNLLKTLVKHEYPGKIQCLTKSDLILRDLDIIKQLKNVEVGFTITSTKNKISKALEVAAPGVEKRLEALKVFNENDIKTYAFIGPVFPYFMNKPDELEDMFRVIKESGTNDIFIDMLNTKDYIAKNLEPRISQQSEDVQKAYWAIKNDDKEVLAFKRYIMKLVKKYDLNLNNKKR
ncbi:MAG TPA: radical SAM protein [Alphaproteobacteria bacterium]|nr:radical SAM protein [Alphaproteobacteria bacterium]